MTYYSALHYSAKAEKSSESAKGYADLAKSYAESINPDNFISKNKITNCITEIPQDIKLELVDGVVTLKAGSKVYVPNGFEADGVTPKFDVVVIESDVNTFVKLDSTYNNSKFCLVLDVVNMKFATVVNGTQIASGTVQPTTGYSIWYDTTNNKVKYTENNFVNMLQCSFPIASITITSGTITSIDQIFNGFGYIGSTVFALPGVKGLIPNGRNADGSLNNIEFVIQNVVTRTFTNSFTQDGVTVFTGTSFSVLPHGTYEYDLELNQNLYNGGVISVVVVGRHSLKSGVFSYFHPKQTFRMVDYSDGGFLSGQAMPSNKYIDLTLGASGTSYTAPANGWFTHQRTAGTANTGMRFSNVTVGSLGSACLSSTTAGTCAVTVPAKKGDQVFLYYNATGTGLNIFRFIYAEGEI